MHHCVYASHFPTTTTSRRRSDSGGCNLPCANSVLYVVASTQSALTLNSNLIGIDAGAIMCLSAAVLMELPHKYVLIYALSKSAVDLRMYYRQSLIILAVFVLKRPRCIELNAALRIA